MFRPKLIAGSLAAALALAAPAGATEVVPESLEGSLMIGSHVLLLLGIPTSHIIHQVRQVRGERYQMLRGFFHGQDPDVTDEPAYLQRLHSITLPEGVEMVMPGDNMSCSVELITPIAMNKELRFDIREGGRTVGAGVITEVIE